MIYMRRRSFFPWGLFIFLMLFGGGEYIFGSVIALAFTLLPIAIIVQIIRSIVGDTAKITNSRTNRRTTTKKRNEQAGTKANTYRIERRLNEYFKENYKLPIIGEIALTTINGKFSTIDDLYITVNDEFICNLGQFKLKHMSTYYSILNLLDVFSKQNDDVLKQEVNVNAPKEVKVSKRSDAQDYIDKINQLNEAIPHAEITSSLNQTCDYLRKIDSASSKDDNKLRKLYDYYLPILVNILENYKKLQVNQENEEFKRTENELIKLTILINEALKEINNSLHNEEYINLNADMKTLESLLKKDVLVDEGLRK